MDTMEETFTVSAEDVRAIKEARSVVLFYRPNGDEGPTWGMRLGTEVWLSEEGSELRLARIARSGVWTRRYASDANVDYSRTIAADPAHCGVTDYRPEGSERKSASWVDSMIRFAPQVRTALGAIRAGDSIGVRFVLGNNSQNTDDAGWVRDECSLRVTRKGKLVGEYLMDVYVGPNNSARMGY